MIALVILVPLAGFVLLALVGKSLAEAEVAEGTLQPPGEIARRMREAAARFAAMTPGDHLAAARAALAQGYDARYGVGGHMREARRHLDAIAADAPEHADAVALGAEITRRREAMRTFAATRLREVLAGERVTPSMSEAEREAGRVRVAGALDQIVPFRFGGVHADGARHTELTFGRRSCDAEFLARVAPRDVEPALGALGFTAVRCANGHDARTLTTPPPP